MDRGARNCNASADLVRADAVSAVPIVGTVLLMMSLDRLGGLDRILIGEV